MRLLLTSTLLGCVCLPTVPAFGQVVMQDQTARDGAASGTVATNQRNATSNNGSLFSVGTPPVLRGSDGTDPTNPASSTNMSQPRVIEDAVPPGGSTYPIRPVQPIDPVAPEQGPGLRRQSAEGPYDPTGIRVGSFLLYPALSLFVDVTDNIDNSSSGQEGRSGRAELELRAESDWSRHRLSLEGRAGIENYFEPEDRDADDELSANAALRLDLADQTQLTITGDYNRQRESANNAELAASGGSASVETDMNAGVVFDHDVAQLQLQLRGSIASEQFDEDASRDFKTYTIGGRIGYRYTDQIIPFVDLEASRKRYDSGASTQNGDNLRAAVGVEVRDREKLSGEASVGVMTWRPDAAGQSEDTILFADASVTWSPNPLWSLTGGLETSLTSSSTGASSVATHAVRLSADYAALRNLDLGASLDVSLDDYRGTNREDVIVRGGLSADYSFNRFAQLVGRFEHERRDSNQAGADYTTNTISVGLRFQR